FTQAAALPLTSITAWELLFDRLTVLPGKSLDPRTLLIVGGAGGVGSILIQLARRLTGLSVVATASRPESRAWCLDLGAHAVIAQHHLLNEIADLIDKGVLRTTLDQTFGAISAANLKRAHALIESGTSRGKIVLEGW